MRVIYTLLMTLSLPIIVGRLWWRGRKLPDYRKRWRERFGHLSLERDERPLVWVHAVSVGETIAAAPLVRRLLARGDIQVLMTCMTPTGSERVRSLFGDKVLHAYLPYDLPWLLRRFLRHARPGLALIIETELWPNTLRACRENGIPVLLLNARLSERSARGYGRLRGFTRSLLQDLTQVAAQNQDDAQRFMDLGLPPERCSVTGSIKFDLNLDPALVEQAAQLKDTWSRAGARPVWIAASTHAGEEEQILAAFARVRKKQPETLLLLVPRHPDRFDAVAALCEASGLPWGRRSDTGGPAADTAILLADTMGEMLLLYGVADIAYVGGSLVPTGGHNLIEPAAWGLPLLSGPHLFNFAEIARLMLGSGGLEIVKDADALGEAVIRLASDGEARKAQGNAARQVADANRGALVKVEALIDVYLPERPLEGQA